MRSINIVLILILTTLYLVTPKGISNVIIVLCLSIFYVNLIASIRKPINIAGLHTYFKINNLFLIFCFIIYYLPYQLYLIGIKDLKNSEFVNDTFWQFTNHSIILSTIGVLAFIIGFDYNFKLRKKVNFEFSKRYYQTINFINLILLSTTGFLFWKTGYSVMISDSYSGSVTGNSTNDSIFYLVTHFILLSIGISISYYFNFKRINLSVFLFLIISLAWSILLLIIGDRNTFFIIAITITAGIFTFFLKIKKTSLISLIIGALIIYQVIEISRINDERNLNNIINTVAEIKLSETGININSFDITTIGSRAAISAVPDKHDFFFGKFKLISGLSFIPYSSRLILSKNDYYTNTSKVIGEEMIGKNATWSVGTNIISDCYIDFGILGVIIFLFFIGLFGKYIQEKIKAHNNSPMWLILYIITIALYSELPRYGIDFPVRNIIWTLIMFTVVNKFYKQKNHEQTSTIDFKKMVPN